MSRLLSSPHSQGHGLRFRPALLGLLMVTGAGMSTYLLLLSPKDDPQDKSSDRIDVRIPLPSIDTTRPGSAASVAAEDLRWSLPFQEDRELLDDHEPAAQSQRVIRKAASFSARDGLEAFGVGRDPDMRESQTIGADPGKSGSQGQELPPQMDPASGGSGDGDAGLHSEDLRTAENVVAQQPVDTTSELSPSHDNKLQWVVLDAPSELIGEANLQPGSSAGPDLAPALDPAAIAGEDGQLVLEQSRPANDLGTGSPRNSAAGLEALAQENQESVSSLAAAERGNVAPRVEPEKQRTRLAPPEPSREHGAAAVDAERDRAAALTPNLLAVEPAAAPSASPSSIQPADQPSSPATFVQRYPIVVVDGVEIGAITMREYRDYDTLVHLGTLLSLFELKMPQAHFARLSSAEAAKLYVSFQDLRGAGFNITYDRRRERLILGVE